MSASPFEPVKKFVRAGAGAGKTWNLTREVIGLALDFKAKEDRWPNVILTTFTRKATQELKERLLIYCLQERPEALEFVHSNSYLQITTMHGLMSRFLNRYGNRLGFPSQIDIIDNSKANFWRRKVLKSFIDRGEIPEPLNDFNIKKLTDSLYFYEKQFWKKQFRPIQTQEEMQHLSQSFCDQMASQLELFASLAQDEVDGEKWQIFFDQLSLVIASLQNDRSWKEKCETIPDLMDSLKKKKPRKSKNTPGLSDDLAKSLTRQRETLEKWLTTAAYSEDHWPKRLGILSAFDAFAKECILSLYELKKEEGAIETDDLEFFSLKLIDEQPQAVSSFRETVDAWFIDEFQDTSPLQMRILDTMIGDQSCYMVGDPQQSIYLFRGSRSEVFFREQKKKKDQGGEVLFLQKNYRSQAHLLNFFNELFPRINKDFQTMEATQEGIESSGSVVVHSLPKDETDLDVPLLSEQLKSLLDQGVNPSDIAILLRNRKQMGLLQKELTRLGFPVLSHASSQFRERREVLDAMALLQFLLNPWDNKNLILLLRSPWLEISDQDLVGLLKEAKGSYWPLVKEFFIEKKGQGLLLEKALRDVREKGYAWVLKNLLQSLGLFDYSHVIDPSGRREANLWKLMNQVERLAREPGGSLAEFVKEGLNLGGLDDVGDEGDADAASEPNKINLMTVHASKGLQFDYVFLPFLHKKPNKTTYQEFTVSESHGLWDLRLPLMDHNDFKESFLEFLEVSQLKEREKQEALRVLYVAMTRAKKQLFLSWQGEPEKDSWAEVLQGFKEDWQESPYVEVVENYEPLLTEYMTTKTFNAVSEPFAHFERSESLIDLEKNTRSWAALKQDQNRRRRGVVLHRVFEALKYHDRSVVVELATQWLPNQKESIEAALHFILDHKDIPFTQIIQRGEVEWGYVQKVDGYSQERRIDLWGVVDGVLWVVDYKTGSTDHVDKAFEQLKGYAETLKAYLNEPNEIQLCAVFPFSEKVFTKTLDTIQL